MSNRSRAYIQGEIYERQGKPRCGSCKWHHHGSDGWVCVNDRSDYCTDYTDYDDYCEDYEGRSVDCQWR